MRFFEILCVALVGLFSMSIAAPIPYDWEVLRPEDDEPGPGYGLRMDLLAEEAMRHAWVQI